MHTLFLLFTRVAPDEMPIGFRVVNKTASSLRLEWYPPQKNSIHGEFLGYRLRYRKNMNNAEIVKDREITVSDPEAKVSNLIVHLISSWRCEVEKRK